VTDDWNPSDPDATRVHYDLATWTFEQMAELASDLAEAAVPHAWDGSELMVPEEDEERTDQIIAEVEERLGMPSDDEAAARQPIALADDADAMEFELDDYQPREREVVTAQLVARSIPFRWEDNVLLVSVEDESTVDSILDHIDEAHDGDAEDLDDLDGSDDGEEQLPFETLTTFFLAGERLRRNPLDAGGLEQLLAATEVADPDHPPYGVDRRLWTRSCELADGLAAALVDGDDPDVEQAEEIATELHDLLRPYV
jgi:hypothetical protein